MNSRIEEEKPQADERTEDQAEYPKPPPGADPETWYSIPSELHKRASRMAQVIFGQK